MTMLTGTTKRTNTSTELAKDKVKEFALAGNATMTLLSGNTNRYYTYRIQRHKEKEHIYFVKYLGKSNNDDLGSYFYAGVYYSDTGYFHAANDWNKRPADSWPPVMRAIKYFFKVIDNIPDKLHVYHEGRCGRCGRKLTTPESIERGLGPECYRR